MIFKPYYYSDTGCAAYLFGCGGLGACAVVDPQARDIDAYESFAASKGMRITHVIDTHVHADHLSGGAQLATRVGAHYCLHADAPMTQAFKKLTDGQELVFGNTRATILHTPGHSAESICLVVTDLRRGPAPWFVLTGDTMFVGAVGRPDLPGDERKNAGQLYDSIHDKLLSLADEIEVYPGHFAGSSCGADMSGKPSSTIGYERRWNPMLTKSRDEFIDALRVSPAKPAEMEHILRQNQGRADTPSDEPTHRGGTAS